MFAPLPDKPDHDALELEILALWERERTFEQLRELNADGPRFSFVDGPVTANRRRSAVHTAWGRTLKDVFQRYKALRGYHQRYQNGFDCQGLWIEVGVERELGLNSKREIEEYGLAEFARRCREGGRRSSRRADRRARTGSASGWTGANDYFTFSDTNIEYIWRFLKLVHERGWLYLGHRSTEWCPRCGTSLSQHELTQAGVYQERSDPSLYVRFPLARATNESLVVWTTTPWTLPANVAAAVKPDAEYGLRENGEWVAVARYPDEHFDRSCPRRGARRASLPRPLRRPRPGRRGRASGHPVGRGLARGGNGHRPHRAGRRPGGLRARPRPRPAGALAGRRGGPLLRRVRLAARDSRRATRPTRSSVDLAEQGFLLEAGTILHRYPHCWRCDTPLIWRVTDDWLISVEQLRAAAARRERDGRVDARVHGQAHGRLAAQHGRLEHLAPPLLRASAALLPLSRAGT